MDIFSEDIVITGLGCCTSLGVQADQLLEEIRSRTDTSSLTQTVRIPDDLSVEQEESLAAVQGPDPTVIAGIRRPFPDRPTLMAVVAVDEAIAAAGLDTRVSAGIPFGLVLNTCFGPSQTVERFLRTLLQQGPTQVSAIAFSRAVSNSVVGELSRRHNLRGPSTAVLGSSALSYGIDLLADNRAEAIICVGVDEVRDLHLWAYRHAGLLAGGMLIGEGASALVIERASAAAARGARITAKVVGHSMGFCAESVHRITDVTEESLACCMEEALSRSRRAASDVGWIVAAENGHVQLAEVERAAARRVLGHDSQWLAPKRVLGESFGAAEGLGAIIGASALRLTDMRMGMPPLCMINTCQVGGAVSSMLLEKVQ